MYPETNPWWSAIGINPHNFRPIVGSIAYSLAHRPRYLYNNKRNGTSVVDQQKYGVYLNIDYFGLFYVINHDYFLF